MNNPYIHTTEHLFINRPVDFDNEKGVTYEEAGGEHSFWAVRVPFLPSMTSGDFTRLGGQSRIPYIQQRQVRFLYDIVRFRENLATFELRFIATPNPVEGQPNLIDIIFLGKVFSTRQGGGKQMAIRLWEKFVNVFPSEDPFNYPLEPVVSSAEFLRFYAPLNVDSLRNKNILEIRKYEDMPIRSMAPLGRVERKGDYVAHPFVPSVNFNPMGRFLTALADQSQKCYASISLRPTRMYDQEVYNASFAIGQFKKTAGEDDDITEEYIRSRSTIGAYIYQQLMAEREQLAMVRVHLVGEKDAPYALAEALGSEMMGNIKNAYPTQWTLAQPADETELQSAVHNIKYLEQDLWGHTLASAPLQRFRYMVTPQEAYGAFRLPVAPESGYLPGVLVKNEPFVAFAEELETQYQARANLNDSVQATQKEAAKPRINLGMVYHRGNPTSQPFTVKVEDLVRHTLIAGSTGSGKSTTIKHLLSQLWIQHQIPFLVLYPIDKNDYRDLRGFQSLDESMLIFTLGDANTSPFRFNPFEVPDGLLLKTHISRLMRVFMAAFTLQDPLPMIYRDALRQVYRQKGWDTVQGKGAPERDYPTMSEFYETIRKIADGLEYGREIKDNVRQASVIRIADLLENAGHVVNVRSSMSFEKLMNLPTVMEIGRVGSTQDTSLLMGFLLMRLAEEIERHPRSKARPHITVVEEAHRLMAEVTPGSGASDSRSSAGEDFANILAEVRGYGEGLIIAEQIPTMLVKGAIGNTFLKIMHWLEDAPSFDLFSNIMNLDAAQREYARTLATGFSIVRSPSGRPVHIKIPEFGDQNGFQDLAEDEKSDEATHKYMKVQRQKAGLVDVNVLPWEASLAATANSTTSVPPVPANTASSPLKSDDTWRVEKTELSYFLGAPMKTCLRCRPLQQKLCPYRRDIRQSWYKDLSLKELADQWLDIVQAPSMDRQERWKCLEPFRTEFRKRLTSQDTDSRGLLYCYFAHVLDEWQHNANITNDVILRQISVDLLIDIDAKGLE
jgi:Predicted ATPase